MVCPSPEIARELPLSLQARQPLTIHSLDCLENEPALKALLRAFVAEKNFPHLIVHGVGLYSSARVSSLVSALLSEVFGAAVIGRRDFSENAAFPNARAITSRAHTEVYAPSLGFRDKDILQSMIQNLVLQQAARTEDGVPFRVMVIHDAHALSFKAQASLRRTAEMYSNRLRLIFVTDSLAQIIPPLQSRCLTLSLPDELTRSREREKEHTRAAYARNCPLWRDALTRTLNSHPGKFKECFTESRGLIGDLVCSDIPPSLVLEAIVEHFYRKNKSPVILQHGARLVGPSRSQSSLVPINLTKHKAAAVVGLRLRS